MYLEDALDFDCGLQQDEWSITDMSFGKEGQLTVLGWSGKRAGSKMYVVECDVCREDSELFGDGIFLSPKNSLSNGAVPCGCTISPYWTEDQYKIICSRKAELLGNKFIGWDGVFKGCAATKVIQECSTHGVWKSAKITTVIRGTGCPRCHFDEIAKASRKPDDLMVEGFFKSEGFHPDTIFSRSDRKDKRGHTVFWKVECPDCGSVGESLPGNLRKGKRPCLCGKYRQQEAYINFIKDGDNIICLKFGISRDSNKRLKQQVSRTLLEVVQHAVYNFPTVEACKDAEKKCKETFLTGVISKFEMPDGYTETTYTHNLGEIVKIYESFGGTLKN